MKQTNNIVEMSQAEFQRIYGVMDSGNKIRNCQNCSYDLIIEAGGAEVEMRIGISNGELFVRHAASSHDIEASHDLMEFHRMSAALTNSSSFVSNDAMISIVTRKETE